MKYTFFSSNTEKCCLGEKAKARANRHYLWIVCPRSSVCLVLKTEKLRETGRGRRKKEGKQSKMSTTKSSNLTKDETNSFTLLQNPF